MRHRPAASDTAAGHADDLFRQRLENQIDLRHPLVKLAQRKPWAALEDALKDTLPPAPTGGGRPALPIRLMAGLLYLKGAYNLSDEAVCERWLENPYWQFFTGEVFFQTKLPCDSQHDDELAGTGRSVVAPASQGQAQALRAACA